MGTTTETRISSTQAKDAIYKAHSISSSASKIDAVSLEERSIPDGFDISLYPAFRVWKNKNTRTFETNVKAKKLFEDVFADKIVYVKTTGNDTTGDGSFTNPYRTIYKGLRTKPLDPLSGGKLTIYVEAGTYTDAEAMNSAGIYANSFNLIGYNGLVKLVQTSSSTTNGTVRASINYYFENIIFSGGLYPFYSGSTTGYIQNGNFKNCVFENSSTSNGVNILINGLFIFESCIARNNYSDGFNYHNVEASTVSNQLIIEINCKAYNNGAISAANNGSTIHDKGNIIRINGEYYSNKDRNIHDINNCKSWNLGCNSRDGLSITDANFAIGSTEGDTSKMWLDTCKSSGSNLAVNSFSTSANIYTYDFIDTCLTPNTATTIPYEY